MIPLTRLSGAPFALNPDLVERVDCTPDTVITLVDGTKYLVSETLREVSNTILAYGASIIALADAYTSADYADGAGSETTDLSNRRRFRLNSVSSSPQDDDPGQASGGGTSDVGRAAHGHQPATLAPRRS